MFDLVELTEESRKAAGIDMMLAAGHEALAAVTSLGEVRSLIEATEAHALARLEMLGGDRRLRHPSLRPRFRGDHRRQFRRTA